MDRKTKSVVLRASEKPFTTRSDYARENAEDIAAASGMGFITTKHDGAWTNIWRPTARGLNIIERMKEESPWFGWIPVVGAVA